MIGLARRHPVLVAAFTLALCAALFFAGRLVVQTVYWSQHRNEAVQPWMTIGYVGRSWGLPPREIDARADLPVPESGHPKTLQQIADERGIAVAEVIALVERTVAEMRAERAAGGGQP
ncbi:hypothetical protein [Gemmobacter caeruleus]|uniref:hypothetical protein n=1 Tax=Gemmobacter caeruleus TaxID=2595004 RepID=UPI0011ECA7ED|nr:hypothetical protein [Gemmobacter caeruleus]